jgi:hypothetical protein
LPKYKDKKELAEKLSKGKAKSDQDRVILYEMEQLNPT